MIAEDLNAFRAILSKNNISLKGLLSYDGTEAEVLLNNIAIATNMNDNEADNWIPKKIKSPAKCPNCGSDNTRLDYDYLDTMSCCDSCGCDFITESGEIILDPSKL